jgi:hypothetical protein
MRKYVTTLLILTLATFITAGAMIENFEASPGANKVTLTWTTNSETSIQSFQILRSSDDVTFTEINDIKAAGPGTQYIATDENVFFKSSALFYKITALDASGNIVEQTRSKLVYPNTTGMFRTWGAIKAMFR